MLVELPNIDVAEISRGDKVAEIYEQFDIKNNLVSVSEIGHF